MCALLLCGILCFDFIPENVSTNWSTLSTYLWHRCSWCCPCFPLNWRQVDDMHTHTLMYNRQLCPHSICRGHSDRRKPMTTVVGEDFESTDEHTAGTDSLLVQLVQAHSSAAVLWWICWFVCVKNENGFLMKNRIVFLFRFQIQYISSPGLG